MQQKPDILIVEDQFVEANHLRIMLTQAGYPVMGAARSVAEAREIIHTSRPGLVLLDIFLSGKDTGIELAKYLHEEHIPFIYLSANSNEDVLNAAKATHPYGFLVKPFREKDLLITMDIARHHQENGLQSIIRKEKLFRQQIKNLPDQFGDWNNALLLLTKALQPLIPFDLVSFQRIPGDLEDDSAFLRIGFDEYQHIGSEEWQTITRLKAHELRRHRQHAPADSVITLTAGEDFNKRCRSSTAEKLMADTFGMQTLLLVPVPLLTGGQGQYLFSFLSRQPAGFTKEHLAIAERLQEPLIYAIERLLFRNSESSNAPSPSVTTTNDPRINPGIIGTSTTPGNNSGINTRTNPSTTPGINSSNNPGITPGNNSSIIGTGIIGRSPLLLSVLDNVAQVAPSDTSVLITGESGTGKESIAEAIHRLSRRNNHPLIKVNCAALPATLAESELFGHERGAFTGATERRIGRFEQSSNGTLFLDEIGDMSLEIQAKLLRALQEHEIERLGSSTPISIDTRIIAATNRNLEKEVAAGRFRLDLYYRLNVFPIHLPPLRQRPEDILALSRHFLDVYSRKTGKTITHLSNKVLEQLLAYSWPGNIRELENLIQRGVVLSKSDTLEDLPLLLPSTAHDIVGGSPLHLTTIRDNERAHILAILKRCNGRIRGIGGAAELLGVPPTTLASKMQRLGIKRSHL